MCHFLSLLQCDSLLRSSFWPGGGKKWFQCLVGIIKMAGLGARSRRSIKLVEVRRDSSQIKEKERRREGKPQMGKTGGRPSFYNNGDQRGQSVMDKATSC